MLLLLSGEHVEGVAVVVVRNKEKALIESCTPGLLQSGAHRAERAKLTICPRHRG